MKKTLISLLAVLSVGYALTFNKKSSVLIAQTLPYTLTVAWDASTDATAYNCYLDGTFQLTVTGLTCQFPVNNLGTHTVGVTAVNNTFVPAESAPTFLGFMLQQPKKVLNVKVK